MSLTRYIAWLALWFCTAASAQDNSVEQRLDAIRARLTTGDANASPLFLSTEDRRLVFSRNQAFLPTRDIIAGDTVWSLEPQTIDLSDLTYTVDDQTYTLATFLMQEPLMGLVVARDHALLYEHYADDHGPEALWVSFSVTKSVTSMLVGAAIADGFIDSIDDQVEAYLPRLRGTPYGAVKLKHILQMASGIAWNEDYANPESDVAKAGAFQGVALTEYLAKLSVAHEPGEVFNYNTGETNLVGEVLRAAIGNNASTYLSTKIWQAFGMESNAVWLIDQPGGGEAGGCCISATVRDYARLGLFAYRGGELDDGTQVLPPGWMDASTTPSSGNPGYGFLWWMRGLGTFSASGIFGQLIHVDPETGVVVATHSNAPAAVDTEYQRHLAAVAQAIVQHFRHNDAIQ